MFGHLEQRMQAAGNVMVGVITTRHLLTHGRLILSEFGARTYLRALGRCLFSSKPTTFLQCVWR
jgi:hypothetical protein